jgi:hypothetical protein
LSPNETVNFNTMDDLHAKHNIIYPLTLVPNPNQTEFEWLDLGEVLIGGSTSAFDGYTSLTVSYSNNGMEDSHDGIKIVKNNQFMIKQIKRFVLMDQISWKVNKGGSVGWETLLQRVIYLGNGNIEGNYGFENDSGILLTPYSFV